jgi:hypothetical protein
LLNSFGVMPTDRSIANSRFLSEMLVEMVLKMFAI